jgi:hypothetical protein
MASLTAASSGTNLDGRNWADVQLANKGFRHTGETEHRVASISETQTFPNSPVEVVICRATKVAKMISMAGYKRLLEGHNAPWASSWAAWPLGHPEIHEAAKERIGQPLDGKEVSA